MEYDKINNLLRSEELGSAVDSESENLSKFVTRQYVKVNSLPNTYNENKSIRFKTLMLRSDLCDYADAYILINGTITVAGNAPRDRQNRPVILKNDAPFISCITRINGELIENVNDLDVVMPMYNLLEYSENYRKTTGSLYKYYRDELDDDADFNNYLNNNVVSSSAFQYKSKLLGKTYNVASTIAPAAAGARVANPNYDANRTGTKELTLVVSLKYIGNFWRALNIPLISCEVSLELKWDKICIITSDQVGVNLDGRNTAAPTGATFAINNSKLHVPVVTLSKDDEIKLLTNLKSGFKREVKWNKYRSQMSTEAAMNNLSSLVDPTFTNVNRLFVLAYEVDNNNDNRKSFFQFYLPRVIIKDLNVIIDKLAFFQFHLPRVMIKDFNVIIDKSAFFDLPIKTEEEAYEKIIDISKNEEYTTGNLLDYDYFKKYYQLIAIDLSKQQLLLENKELIQQINFIGRLDINANASANVFIIIEKKENTILELSQNFANVLHK